MMELKLLVIGDQGVGKSCLLVSYDQGYFPSEYVPSAFHCNVDVHRMTVEETAVNIHLNDGIFGMEDKFGLRTITYPGTNIFLICFSVTDRNSFLSVESKWLPEVKRYCPETVCVIVAYKIDLRSSEQCEDIVTYEEGSFMAQRLGVFYQETSSRTKDGLKMCFEKSVRSVLSQRGHEDKPKQKRRKRKCSVM